MGRKVSGNVISEIKMGELIECLRVCQQLGMVVEDLKNVSSRFDLAVEVFRLIRDSAIFRNKKYADGHERDEQIGKFREWNNELRLGIPEADFNQIPEKFPYPPQSTVNQLYATCLVYEFGDPLETLLRGFKILDYELQKVTGQLEVSQSMGGIFQGGGLGMIIPEKIPADKVCFRSGCHTFRKKGFRFVVAELGRSFVLNDKVGKDNEGWRFFKDLFFEREKRGIKNMGQELPYFAAMYPGWITSVCSESRIYPRPLALDIQIDSIYRDFRMDHIGCLRLEENMSSYSRPAYGKGLPFLIRADDFSLNYAGNDICGRGYGVCTIIEET